MSAEVHDIDTQRQRKAIADLDGLLAKSEKGPLACLSNLILIVGQDPTLAPLCAYDEFAEHPVLRLAPPLAIDSTAEQPGPYPRAWRMTDVVLVQNYIQRTWCRAANKSDTEDAMMAVAASRRFHPVRDWLASLQWDYKPRLDLWLTSTFGAADDPYHRAVAAAFLIAAVRRIRRPGVKHDCMPVFEGEQGIKKSTALRVLFSDAWFSDSMHPDLGHKDAAIGLHGKWCVEFAEVEHLVRTEVEVLKAYLARQADRYKPPYGRTFVEVARQSVFAGTTNTTDYLRDASGNRRFWPIACPKVDIAWLTDNREQLWAEAAFREAQQEPHWLDVAETAAKAAQQQAERQRSDVWEDAIAVAVQFRKKITAAEILTDVLQMPKEKQGRSAEMRVADILRGIGWKSVAKWEQSQNRTLRWWEKVVRD